MTKKYKHSKLRRIAHKSRLLLRDRFLSSSPSDSVVSEVDSNIRKSPSTAVPAESLAHRDLPSRHNYSFDITEIRDALVNYLCLNGCWIRTIFSENEEVQKICFKYSDRGYIYKMAQEFRVGDISLVIEPVASTHPHRKLRYFRFTNSWEVLGSDKFAFDPWLGDEERVYSHTPNNLVSSVPLLFQERTPLAVGPHFLRGADNFDVDYQTALRIPESADNIVNFPIDVVVTWVDSSDQAWSEKRDKYKHLATGLHQDAASNARFQSRDELRYCLRSVYYFAKFVRNIYLVTDDQAPRWLDLTDQRIKIIPHKEIFPDNSDLPVFNSHAIEANLHRIEGLSENFIYLNDDVFLWNKCRPTDFFDYSGGANIEFEKFPNIYGESLASVPAWRTSAINVNKLMIERFGAAIYKPHLHIPFSMKRSVMEQIWSEFPDAMKKVSKSRFRSHEDISPASFFYPTFAYLTGAARVGSTKSIRTSLGRADFRKIIENAIQDPDMKFLCINDDDSKTANQNDSSYRELMAQKFSSPAPWEKDQ